MMCRYLLAFLLGAATLGAQPAGWLKVISVEGEGAFNNIRQKVAHSPVVEVRDEKDQVVAGATVTFILPDDGASAMFENKQRSFQATTDSKGRAAAGVMRPNGVEGRFNIRITAVREGREGNLVISQSNTIAGGVRAEGKSSAKKYIILALIGGAGAGLGIGLRGRGGTTPPPAPPPPTAVSVGGVTVGGPR